jgi:gamma-glutamyltranspeptidase/glutathione hydrolase
LSGIGGFGGAIMLYAAHEKKAAAINFNSPAPARATPDMFAGKPEANRLGPLSVGVPGVLRGLEAAVKQLGCAKWADVVAPAQALAEDGVVVASGWPNFLEQFAARWKQFPATAALFLPNGRPPRDGEKVRFPDLARSLSLIAREGADAFYEGELARKIASYLQAEGGLLTTEDLRRYQPIIAEPLRSTFRGHGLLTTPLPGGGASVLQCLRVLEQLPLPDTNDAEYTHLLIQTLKLIWRERLTLMADPACVDVPLARLLSDAHARELARQIVEDKIPNDFEDQPDWTFTTHVCAADTDGNLVSLTTTIGDSFGSFVSVPGTGIVLGHGLGRFSVKPGHPNCIAPGKLPLHNMSPLLICRDDAPWAVIGWTGGRKIPNVVAQAAVNLIHFRADITDALGAPMVHCEGNEPVSAERKLAPAMVEALAKRGHRLQLVDELAGYGAAIVRDPDTGALRGVSDPRRNGVALSC